MITPRHTLPLLCLAAVLWLTTGCAPTQALSPEEKTAELERLQQLRQELASLKAQLAAAKTRDLETNSIPESAMNEPGSVPGWRFRVGDQPLPSADGYYATVIADKQRNAESLTRLLTLIESRSIVPNRASDDQLLFIIPALNTASNSLTLENYDALTALELIRDWPEAASGSAGPFLLLQPAAGKHRGSARLLIDLERLTTGEQQQLLATLRRTVANASTDASALLLKLLQFRVDSPAVVSYHQPDFSIAWRHE